MSLTYEQKCFQWASNQFLYEEIPDEYFEMSEEEQHKHLEYYAWEAVEHYDGYKLSNIIDNLAQHIIQEIYPKKEYFNDSEIDTILSGLYELQTNHEVNDEFYLEIQKLINKITKPI